MKITAILLGVFAIVAVWFVWPEYIEMATEQKREQFVQPKRIHGIVGATVRTISLKDPFMWVIDSTVFVLFVAIVLQLAFFLVDKRLISLPLWITVVYLVLVSIPLFYPLIELKIIENGQVVVNGTFTASIGVWYYFILLALAFLIGSYIVQKKALITKKR